jgi:hypothetical protein
MTWKINRMDGREQLGFRIILNVLLDASDFTPMHSVLLPLPRWIIYLPSGSWKDVLVFLIPMPFDDLPCMRLQHVWKKSKAQL